MGMIIPTQPSPQVALWTTGDNTGEAPNGKHNYWDCGGLRAASWIPLKRQGPKSALAPGAGVYYLASGRAAAPNVLITQAWTSLCKYLLQT